jgi:hypothetical protein
MLMRPAWPGRPGLCGLALSLAAGRADTTNEAVWARADGGNGHIYRVVAKASLISWDQASAEAQAAGGYLATITSAAENEFVFRLIDAPAFWKQTENGHGPWIGGFQSPDSSEPAGGWKWVTQPGAPMPESFTFTHWEMGEPNNLTATADGVNYNQDRAAFFHAGSGRAATWSDEFNQTGLPLNQWTISYVIEFGPVPAELTATEVAGPALQLAFTNPPGLVFTVLTATNLSLPAANWTSLGAATEAAPGQYQFVDTNAPGAAPRFYQVSSP